MTESKVYLRDGKTGLPVEASFFDAICDGHLKLWDEQWVPAMRSLQVGQSSGESPEDVDWDWRRKSRMVAGLLSFHSFAIVCGGELQGLLITSEIEAAQHPEQRGKPLAYVELVATAPWNRTIGERQPRYRGVGSVFVLAVIQLSRELGFKGRVGLHSMPTAETFYEKCGFTKLSYDPSHQDLAYFELTETQADAFRQHS